MIWLQLNFLGLSPMIPFLATQSPFKSTPLVPCSPHYSALYHAFPLLRTPFSSFKEPNHIWPSRSSSNSTFDMKHFLNQRSTNMFRVPILYLALSLLNPWRQGPASFSSPAKSHLLLWVLLANGHILWYSTWSIEYYVAVCSYFSSLTRLSSKFPSAYKEALDKYVT